MLPRSPVENSWPPSLPCHGPAPARALSHPAGTLGVLDLDPALQGESQAAAEIILFSQNKNKWLCPGRSV